MKLDGWLLAVCLARTCMTSVFMTYAAVLPVLRTRRGHVGDRRGLYLDGLPARLRRRPRGVLGARRVFIGSAWLGAVTAIAFGLWARSYATALLGGPAPRPRQGSPKI